MDNHFHHALVSLCDDFLKLLNSYQKSDKLQKYFADLLSSFFYGNIIINFFNNLTRSNVKEYSLPYGKIKEINEFFGILKLKSKKGVSSFKKNDRISREDYNEFKNGIKKSYPDFFTIIQHIEKEINYPIQEKKLHDCINKIKNTGVIPKDATMDIVWKTLMLEYSIESSDWKLTNLSKSSFEMLNNALEKMSSEILTHLDKNFEEMLKNEQKRSDEYENIIQEIWLDPFRLMRGFIKICSESVEMYLYELSQMKYEDQHFKLEALSKLFNRAIQIANEILILANHGYADGAFARWRSLHEIMVISLFLNDNEEDISERFLDFAHVSNYQDALIYKEKYKKLGYASMGRKELNILKRNFEEVKQRYGPDFTKKMGWIPTKLSIARNFLALEAHVKFDKFRPFYRQASNLIHVDHSSFFSLGNCDPHKYFDYEPSPWGLAEPLDNCIFSLLNTTLCILNYNPTFESVLKMKVICEWSSRASNAIAKVNLDDHYWRSEKDNDSVVQNDYDVPPLK